MRQGGEDRDYFDYNSVVNGDGMDDSQQGR